jgi:uncharacterized protein YqeY
MTIKNDLENALKDALRKGDDTAKRTLRMALAAIRFVEIEKKITLDDASILTILHKEIKSRRESIADAERAKRADLVAGSQAEIAILEAYLPKAFSTEELEFLVRQAITESGATSMSEVGQVMKLLIPRLQGKATGDQASQVVRKLLQG